ncbi:MAG: hypothetical protein HC883_03850 [Bdellovibrionaceae bacterium]|nr:hypothetical protein [Pseudobdellovibrionaceae bacterium]
MRLGEKYKSQKVSLATAVSLWRNKKSGLRRMAMNLGVIGKYNRETKSILPGAGISGVAGPFTFGYAYSKDEFFIEARHWDFPKISTINIGPICFRVEFTCRVWPSITRICVFTSKTAWMIRLLRW